MTRLLPRLSSARRVAAATALVAWAMAARAEAPPLRDPEDSPHDYLRRPLQDPFTRRLPDLVAGRIPLDRSGELPFLRSFLREFEIPESSQMLVFSTTSLQLSLISPSNPRALYFNEDVYVGFIPGGRIEVIALDPALGGIFYILDIPRSGQPLVAERSGRCLNCHARDDTGGVPGLVVKSVIPGPGGGSLTAYRIGESGHGIPLSDRFGGWHVTGAGGFTNHHGNLTGRLGGGTLTLLPNPPGERFDWDRYPVRSSGLVPQLVHEHQVGFVNRVVRATYWTREALEASGGRWTPEQEAELGRQARELARYILFVDEAPLPAGGVPEDPAFQEAFRKGRRRDAAGNSLKDFDLRTRLFRHRCSYMIHGALFAGLPSPMKQRVYQEIGRALGGAPDVQESGRWTREERESVRSILKATLPDLPAGW